MLEERAGERTGLCVQQLGAPKETDGLETWAHHHGCDTVDDEMMREAGSGLVSFIFSLHVSGRDVNELAEIAQQREADELAKAQAAAEAEAAAAAGKENSARLLAGGRKPAGPAALLPVGRNALLLAQRAAAQAAAQRPARPVRSKRARILASIVDAASDADSDEDEPSVEDEMSEEAESSAPPSDDEDEGDE